MRSLHSPAFTPSVQRLVQLFYSRLGDRPLEVFAPILRVVDNRFRSTLNLRTQVTGIIRRAGLFPWERLFHNPRATRRTELSDQFPLHVASRWMGNIEDISTKHPLHTTEELFHHATFQLSRTTQKTTLAV